MKPEDDLFARLRKRRPEKQPQVTENETNESVGLPIQAALPAGASSQLPALESGKPESQAARLLLSAQAESEESVLAEREQRLAESLLDNESLTDGLDDAAANQLIEWGMALARHAARSTRGMDKERVKAEMDKRREQTGRALRMARNLASRTREADPEAVQALLSRLTGQLKKLYGGAYQMPAAGKRRRWLEDLPQDARPDEMIAQLRHLVEAQEKRPDTERPHKPRKPDPGAKRRPR